VSAGLVGLLIGLLAGVVGYLAVQRLKGRVEMAETRRVLQIVSVIDLVLLPVLGYLIGAYVFK
jgi:ABC-type lipoprotein release transport system permease subunit